ncbi:MAG TPA: SusC/RagA family TonB-linked outer membrane protein [Ferruginibacter sp.]|nr:SusC/RagA family TonB-linked outer membrane protein [Ferruginibacter sp.]
MRRFLSLFTMLMLCGVLAFAQSRVVSGKVTDASGKPVPFASVLIKGGRAGVQTDANGEFTIRVNSGDVLQISQASYNAVDIPVGSLNSITASLNLKDNTIPEVIVTSAFGIKRTARSTSSNVQQVTSDQLNTIRQSNVNDALAGKVAGIQVQSQSAAKLGVGSNVRLRGENNLALGTGALYVVDGTVISNSTDINVDDIEDVNVLQGPAASALFGSAGANGAIVITSKKARRGVQKGLGIELNSSLVFDKVYILPNYQNTYAGGNGEFGRELNQYHWQTGQPDGWKALDGKYYPDYTEDESWGPRMIGQEYIPWYAWYGGHERSYQTASLTPQPNNVKDFYATGVTRLNNVNFSKSAENLNVRLSYTNLDVKGLLPNSWLKKNTFNITSSFDLSNHFVLSANINYVNTQRNAENDDTYSNNSTGSFNQWFHRDIDVNILQELRGLKTPAGVLATWNHDNPDTYSPANPKAFYGAYYWMNPYSYADNKKDFSISDRLFGDAALTYKVNNDLRFKLTYRREQLDQRIDNRQYQNIENSLGTTFAGQNIFELLSGRAAVWGYYERGFTKNIRQNIEFLGSYSKNIGQNFKLNANAGVDIFKQNNEYMQAHTMGGLSIKDFFALTNSVNPINFTTTPTNPISNRKGRSVFARADIGFRNILFIDGAFRREFSSTETPGHGINTKAIGASFVFSDLLKSPILSYGKLRASYGQILNTLTPYQNSVVYAPGQNQWNGNILMGEPNSVPDPGLHGASQTEKEIGLEARFLKNRAGFNLTYWDRTNKDFPFNLTVNDQSGYTGTAINIGEIAKTGVELSIMLVPIRSRNVDWTINFNYAQIIKNEVVSIAPGIKNFVIQASGNGGVALVVDSGARWGQLRGTGIKRDANGVPLLTSDGYLVQQKDMNLGSALPKYTGGIQNSLTLFKNFDIRVNIDYSVGGNFFSLSKFYGAGTGLYDFTAGYNDKGIPIRDRVVDGGGIRVDGVDETTLKPVTYYVNPRSYYQNISYTTVIAEPYIESLTFVKLRELSIGYRLPVERLGLGRYLNGAQFSVIARNPWLIYSKAKGFDPSEISDNRGEQGQFPGTRSMGVNLKLIF